MVGVNAVRGRAAEARVRLRSFALAGLALALCACNAIHRGALDEPGPDGAVEDSGAHNPDGDVPSGGFGGSAGAGSGGAGSGGSGGTGGAPANGCRDNPGNAACPEICDEICNGEDDDCDGAIDDGDSQTLCALDDAISVCLEGECLIVECEGRHLDCDSEAATGCEASLDDLATCGGCDAVCEIERAIEGCEAGECVPVGCEPGYDDCDGEGSTVCETEVASTAQCGACDAACVLEHAVPVCEELACAIERCDSGFDDCDEDPETGCEAPLDTLDDCGGCGVPCELRSCSGGVCSDVLCNSPEADCNGDDVDCEVNIATDVNHCGACNAPCTFAPNVQHATGLTCAAMACEPTCDDGFGDCDPDYKNGCETPLDTTAHCGACGNDCNVLLPNVGSTVCTDGVCEVSGCDASFGDCDGMDSTGCETDLRTLEDCGGCSSADQNEPCEDLPHATATACGTGACEITSCEGGWADCDRVAANGCERDTAALGPCLPDTNCTKRSYNNSDYYFCTNETAWLTARDRCRTQTRGDLAHIEDQAEGDFINTHRVADSWIGANDRGVEGTWRWSNDGLPFWRGGSSGSTVLGQHARWGGSQPDDYQGAEDCAEMWGGASWNDQSCSTARDFVCEETADLCPADGSKIDPGQCGCGNADTDTDGDGYASCNDTCPDDIGKQAPGTCGCGVADTNSDGDAQPDCNETCDSDPNKTAPGACGCGVADTNTDGDAQADCNDGCPLYAGSTDAASGCGLGYVPPNVDVTDLNPNQADATTTINCAAVLNTSGTPSFTTWCGGALPQILVHSQGGGVASDVAVVAFRNLTISSGGSLRIQGSRPAVLVVFGNATIAGTLDANASGATAYAGGNYMCGGSTGGNGACNGESGGGGGGGFGLQGGLGGGGDGCGGGARGIVRPEATLLSPLIGGCGGGNGGGCTNAGAGGGAVQLSASGTLTVTGTVRANGGAASGGCGNQRGGGGGGSGGGIRLEANTLSISGTVQANGGNGGSGDGGGGGGSTSSSDSADNGGTDNDGGGGGGGGYGRVVRCQRSNGSGC